MKHRVLLVDDEPAIRAGLCRTLRKEPYEIVEAGSGEEALRILATSPIDVVVSDEEMPGMRGTTLLKKVREQFPDTVRFMLTGNATLENALQAINNGGITRFFIKPCNDIDLSVSIRQALQQRELLIAAKRLLQQNKSQEKFIKDLETEHPNITKVNWDDDGAISIDNPEGDFDQLMQEINSQLGNSGK